jgi:hypothetical protein
MVYIFCPIPFREMATILITTTMGMNHHGIIQAHTNIASIAQIMSPIITV